MKRKALFSTAGIALLLFCVLSLTFTQNTARAEDRIPITAPAIKDYTMPQVFFSHERHVEVLGEAGQDCTSCHVENDEGMSETFLHVEKFSVEDGVRYMHDTCTACHVTMKRGPNLVECRLCHRAADAK